MPSIRKNHHKTPNIQTLYLLTVNEHYNITLYHQCDLGKLLSPEKVHMNYVVTDWSSALAGFLVSTLFGANPSNFSH